MQLQMEVCVVNVDACVQMQCVLHSEVLPDQWLSASSCAGALLAGHP